MKGEKRIIVIGREFGCGARRIGRLVADRLGVPYYDKELFRQIQLDSGLSAHLLADSDEKRPSFFRSFLGVSVGSASYGGDQSLSDETIYKANSEAIRRIAEEGGAVIVGRTADYILRHHPHLTSVFLHAPIEYREMRLMERGECATRKEARSMAQKNDKLRERYYNYYTGRSWGKANTYHLSLNSSLMSDEEIAELIVQVSSKKKETKSEARSVAAEKSVEESPGNTEQHIS